MSAQPTVMACPFCGSCETEMIAPFASSLLTSQHRCNACRSYFEAVRQRASRPTPDPRGPRTHG